MNHFFGNTHMVPFGPKTGIKNYSECMSAMLRLPYTYLSVLSVLVEVTSRKKEDLYDVSLSPSTLDLFLQMCNVIGVL